MEKRDLTLILDPINLRLQNLVKLRPGQDMTAAKIIQTCLLPTGGLKVCS